MNDRVVILDFGSQYTHLIARRIRELNVHAVVLPFYASKDEILDSRGIILSGGPHSVYEKDAPFPDSKIFDSEIPVLGICYGLQVIGYLFGGTVRRSAAREYGEMEFKPANSKLFKDIPRNTVVWMSHGDKLDVLPEGFKVIGRTENSDFAAINFGKIYGIQFHPEVTHTVKGTSILENFLYDICGMEGRWKPDSYIQIARDIIREECRGGRAVLAYSGGVDSTVCSVIAKKLLGKDFIPVFVDTGLMRKGEVEEIKNNSEELKLGVKIIDAGSRFINALSGVKDPEEKRMIIGKEFINVFEEEAKVLGAEYLIQGTLYPDRIESVSDVGPSQTIKTHHNVGAIPDEVKLTIVEPRSDFFKDEVRNVAEVIGIPESIFRRHPFPGPGLAVRILGEVTGERLKILREADYLYISTLRELNIYDSIWQAFAVYIPVKTVGVMGDSRTYGTLIGLRAVSSEDGMTADWYPFSKEQLNLISRRIMNEVEGVNRVVYDISSKPPSTIEWE